MRTYIWLATAEYHNDSNGTEDVIGPFSSIQEFEQNFNEIKLWGHAKDPDFDCYFVCSYQVNRVTPDLEPSYRRYDKDGNQLIDRSTF
jgi:hypothetical protein